MNLERKKDKGIKTHKGLSFSGLEIWLHCTISNSPHVSQLGNETETAPKERKTFPCTNCRQSGLEVRQSSLNPRSGTLPAVLRWTLKITSGSLVKGAQGKYRR